MYVQASRTRVIVKINKIYFVYYKKALCNLSIANKRKTLTSFMSQFSQVGEVKRTKNPILAKDT